MSDFKAKTHPVRFPLELLPRPRWNAPQTIELYLRGLVLQGGRGRGEKGKKS